MNRLMNCSMLAMALAIGNGVAFAQSATQQPDQTTQQTPQQSWHHGPRGQSHQQVPAVETKHLTKRLALTPDQAAQIEPILAARDAQMKALQPAAGTQPDFKAIHAQRKAIMEDTKTKLNAILNDTQKQQLAQMHHGHGKRGNWGGQQTAPAPTE